jgi:peptidoglycan DL-endopeptidase CwlO
MKKAVLKQTSICLAATVVLCTSSIMNTKAVSFTGETGVAGIELSLGNNSSVRNVIRDSEVVNVLSARMIEEEAAATDDSNITAEDASDDSQKESQNEDADKEDVDKEDADKEDSKEEEVEEPVSEYANVGISIAPTYVNVRKKANTDSKILGKLYKGCAATILETKGDWVKIQSGKVKGYINAEYLAIGFDAEELVEKYGTKIATVNTTTLKVREKKSTDSRVLTMIPIDESYVVLKEYDEWVKVSIDGGSDEDEDNGVVGYVSKDFVDITVEFDTAISIEEEEAKKKAEEAARKAEEEQAAKLQREQEEQRRQEQQSNSSSSNSNSSSSSSSSSSNSSNSSSNSSSSNSSSSSSSSSSNAEAPKGSGTGSNIAAYAQKFVGNPYVYGGTSLTSGADCSGFVMSVYRSFGYSLPRTSSSQATAGTRVDMGSLQPGDLVFYTGGSGRINHVAIYIGGGKVVHASNPRSGIKISSMNYRTPYTARRIVR